MNIEQIKNTLREFQAENRQKFKNTQAEFKKAVSYIKKKCIYLASFSYVVKIGIDYPQEVTKASPPVLLLAKPLCSKLWQIWAD